MVTASTGRIPERRGSAGDGFRRSRGASVAGGMEGRKLWDAPAIDVAEVRRRLDSDE